MLAPPRPLPASRCQPAHKTVADHISRVSSPCYGAPMDDITTTSVGSAEPSHVPTGAALLAIRLGEEAHGIRGLDVLRRSVDRAPPGLS